MIETWQCYRQRAAAFINRGADAREAGDEPAARACLIGAARNLFHSAKHSPHEVRESLLSQAEELAGLADPGNVLTEKPGEDASDGALWQVMADTGVRLKDVAGLAEAKRLVYNMAVRPAADPSGARRWKKRIGGGILLYGPPGTGKTLFARAIAGELEAVFISVSGSSILSKWFGDAEKQVSELFAEATRHERCVLFIDETDALLARRRSDRAAMSRVVTAFLAAMDGIAGRREGLLLLGATNRPGAIDPAALRRNRLERHVYVGLPDEPARRQILAQALDGQPLAGGVNIDASAAMMTDYTGADITAICDEATDTAWDRETATGCRARLTPADIAAATEQIAPSVSAAEVKRYDRWRAGG